MTINVYEIIPIVLGFSALIVIGLLRMQTKRLLRTDISTLASSIDELTPKLNAYRPKLAGMPNSTDAIHEYDLAESALTNALFKLKWARCDLASNHLKYAQVEVNEGLKCITAVRMSIAKLFMATVNLN